MRLRKTDTEDSGLILGNLWGIARTMLAGSQLLLHINSSLDDLVLPQSDAWTRKCSLISELKYNPLCSLTPAAYSYIQISVIIILVLVCLGIKPRWTAIPHWLISTMYASGAVLVEGGDQIASLVTLFLIPFCLADDRWSHFQQTKISNPYRISLIKWSHILLVIQISVIYLHAGLGKLSSPEWRDGTAVYYWTSSRDVGAPSWLLPLLNPLLMNGVSLTLLTWGTIVLESILGIAFLTTKRVKKLLFILGILLHAAIIFVHGLTTFSLIMFACLIFLLKRYDEQLELQWLPWLNAPLKSEALSSDRDRTLVFFDGDCLLCNGFVEWITKIDKNSSIQFATLQGQTARDLLSQYSRKHDSILVWHKNRTYEQSDAIIKILVDVGGFWGLFSLVKWTPRTMRDFLYRLVSKHRLKIGSKRATCRMPSYQDKLRFLP